jgi:peptide alpha-N-acetyltransferase
MTHIFVRTTLFLAATVFTYRYFLYRFPQLCILALDETTNEPIGCVVGKMDEEEVVLLDPPADEEQQHQESQPTQARPNKRTEWTGYIGMLAVSKAFRRQGIGKALVRLVLLRMKALQCTSATLETEVTNTTAQRLYEDCFGFLREELLLRYYLNWNDAYRLRLWF